MQAVLRLCHQGNPTAFSHQADMMMDDGCTTMSMETLAPTLFDMILARSNDLV